MLNDSKILEVIGSITVLYGVIRLAMYLYAHLQWVS